MENFRRQWNLDCITITKIMKRFRKNKWRKWRNGFKIDKFVVLVEYLEKQTDCSRYRKNIIQSRRNPSWRNQSYLSFLIKQIETMSRSYQLSASNLRQTLGKSFDFTEIANSYRLKQGVVYQTVRFVSQYSMKLYIQF